MNEAGGQDRSGRSNQGEGALEEALRRTIGRPAGPRAGLDPVNLTMIRQWCEAFGDGNPVYRDPEAAARSVHGQLVAPPAMLDVWLMPGQAPRPESSDRPFSEVLPRLDAAGFPGVVATNAEHEYDRYLVPGDEITALERLEDVSHLKRTALGPGHFVTIATEYRDARGETVGRMRFRILKFRPADRPSGTGLAMADAGERMSRPPRRDIPLGLDEIRVGDALDPCPVPITPTLIVAGAIATRDFTPVHHDPELARAQGTPDIFMSILSTNGLCMRYVTDWAGPDARVTRLRVRLGVPNFPGDTMVMQGTVERAQPSAAGAHVEVKVRGSNRLGDHATAHIELEL